MTKHGFPRQQDTHGTWVRYTAGGCRCDACRRAARHYMARRKYGVSAEDYERMVDAQAGRCAVCGRAAVLHIDHDHLTGRIRGLLCRGCNMGIGHFRDNADSLLQAAKYLNAKFVII